MYCENKRCMLVSLKLTADFWRRCALPVIAHTFLATHPRRPTLCTETKFAPLSAPITRGNLLHDLRGEEALLLNTSLNREPREASAAIVSSQGKQGAHRGISGQPAYRYRHLPVHRHRGLYQDVGEKPTGHAQSPLTPRRDPKGGHRAARRLRLQDGRGCLLLCLPNCP